MTIQAYTPTAPASARYAPEGYTATINRLLNYPWPDGVTSEDIREAEHAIMRIVIEVAEQYRTGEVDAAQRLVAEKLPSLPGEWSPLLYFEASAQQMAIPVWGEYTDEQRQRGYRYAAHYVMARLAEWLRPAHRHSAAGEPEEKFTLTGQPREVQRAFTELFAAKIEYRRCLTQMQAFMATHPDDEFEPALLRAITQRWSDYKLEQAFF